MVAFRGVVEHHVQDDLDPRRVQRVHHRLELGGPGRRAVRPGPRPSSPGAGRSTRWCCIPSSWSARAAARNASGTLSCTGSSSTAVTPRSDQVGDGRLVAQAGVGAAQLGRHPGVAHGEALDVHLVDDRVRVPAPAGRLRRATGTARRPPPGCAAHWPRSRHPLGASWSLPEYPSTSGPSRDRPVEGPRIRVEQELGRIAAHAPGRIVGSGGPVPVRLPGPRLARHEDVPDAGVAVLHRDLGLGAGLRRTGRAASRRRRRRPPRSSSRHPVTVAPSGNWLPGSVSWRVGVSAMALTALPPWRSGRMTSPTASTSPWRRRIRSATTPVQPVWWNAPIAAPLSPWKYSLKIRLSCQAGIGLQQSRSRRSRAGGRPGRW